MSFGISTVKFVTFEKSGSPDELGHFPLVEKYTNAPGCRHRPLTFDETAELQLDVGTEYWRSTLPLFEFTPTIRAKVMAAKVNDLIEVDGQRYQIVGGVRSFPDENGPFKATIVSKKHIG